MEANNHDEILDNNSQPEIAVPDDERPRPWFQYTIEHRDRKTDELISREYVRSFDGDVNACSSSHDPVFEFVKTVRTRESDQRNGPDMKQSATTIVAPEYHIKIYSVAVINALQSVVDYYPDHDLGADPLIVKWPYAILVHHYEELARFRQECKAKEPNDMCVREKDAYEHIGVLLGYLDDQVMKQVNSEKERNKRGFFSFEWYWVAHKPGATTLQQYSHDRSWTPAVVYSVTGGIFNNPPTSWTIDTWNMTYDGIYLGREMDYYERSKFDGEIAEETRFINDSGLESDELAAEAVKMGKIYWQLLRKQSMHYKGPTAVFPNNEVNSLVVTDLVSYYTHNPGFKPNLMNNSDCRKWNSDCECPTCKRREREAPRTLKPRFDDYNSLTVEAIETLEPLTYLLCPRKIPAYVFKTRTWGKDIPDKTLHVHHFAEPQFDEKLIDSLVMDSDRVQTLKALAKSFTRVNKHGDKIAKPQWAADFIRGKGNGLIFLLHGMPGVGKTCTAEYVAEYIKRPLMTISCSDIGTDPVVVERNLIFIFKKARSWGVVLLIDEADVFMERRSTSDLNRNSLVAGFLRALEFYDGILFLTTNRVGSFDDAFMSRVHVQLHYPKFTDEQRQQLWKTFTGKLVRERGDYMRLNIDAKEYIGSAEVRALEWNGREIRNAFQTAVALAEFEAVKDEENKILITDSHLRAVTQLSGDFKKYLNTLHRGNEAKRAERRSEWLDS